MLKQRERLRKDGEFKKADDIRIKIEREGYLLNDTPKGPRVKKKHG